MHVLMIFAHPRRASFTGALLDAFADGVREGGRHTVEVADLYREGFDPRFQAADEATFRGEKPVPDDVRREQERFDRADAVAFVFPVWWWSFPAVLKGWIDRVFNLGWAYANESGVERGTLRDRPTVLLAVGGAPERTYRKYGYDQAMQVQMETGILGYCGLYDVETHLFYEVDGTAPEERGRYLARAREMGRGLVSPERRSSSRSPASIRWG